MLLLLSPVLAGCGKYDYTAHISDERCDLFLAETENYTVTVSCRIRENPYALDGVAGERVRMVEIVLAERAPSGAEYEAYFIEDVPRGGDMSFRNVSGDYAYSRTVTDFPSGSLSLRIVKDGAAEDLLLTSVKTERTLSTEEILSRAIEAERPLIESLTVGKQFCGEFHVRLLRRDKTYYYVGIVDRNGKTVALLLDSETGETLARRAF